MLRKSLRLALGLSAPDPWLQLALPDDPTRSDLSGAAASEGLRCMLSACCSRSAKPARFAFLDGPHLPACVAVPPSAPVCPVTTEPSLGIPSRSFCKLIMTSCVLTDAACHTFALCSLLGLGGHRPRWARIKGGGCAMVFQRLLGPRVASRCRDEMLRPRRCRGRPIPAGRPTCSPRFARYQLVGLPRTAQGSRVSQVLRRVDRIRRCWSIPGHGLPNFGRSRPKFGRCRANARGCPEFGHDIGTRLRPTSTTSRRGVG